MKYVNATNVLPEELVMELQKYIQGETLYIPKEKKAHRKWGANSGARERIEKRNERMKEAFVDGASIEELASCFFLSQETVKKIVYKKKG